ncbi:cytidylyltransferase domain containing protein [Theileria equi strain WA]|uniref:Cytidylyltransferase domain containing protein n=1 Tax=Theileria equi strain WA TaxID=1537102 RepID=L1LD29_THEEQ|nr:cytidylyltransferase domain containing protein [Theileria equi strain WA]EKX73327.1 cytidylyltransferase domain containing protein [Theileria equi strain WA]|eukprot:XP_004832779.1 cytidylyltransferase domain containing protein [Theileria equi strain WA]
MLTPVLLFCGAFDPITKAHMLMLELSIKTRAFEEIWIMPSGDRTDKKYRASDEDRIAMCNIVVDIYKAQFPKLQVSRFEMDKNETIDTYFTIKDLQAQYPDRDFYFFLGSDILPSMFEWPYADELIKIAKFLIAYRQDYPINDEDLNKLKSYKLMDELLKQQGKDTAMSDVSSTMAREQIKRGEVSLHTL